MMVFEKKVITFYFDGKRQFKLRIDCAAALLMMASIVLGDSVQQLWPSLSYQIRFMEVSTSVGGPY